MKLTRILLLLLLHHFGEDGILELLHFGEDGARVTSIAAVRIVLGPCLVGSTVQLEVL